MTHPTSDGSETPAANAPLPTWIAISAGEPWGHSHTARQSGVDATSSGLVGLGVGSNRPTDSTKAMRLERLDLGGLWSGGRAGLGPGHGGDRLGGRLRFGGFGWRGFAEHGD